MFKSLKLKKNLYRHPAKPYPEEESKIHPCYKNQAQPSLHTKKEKLTIFYSERTSVFNIMYLMGLTGDKLLQIQIFILLTRGSLRRLPNRIRIWGDISSWEKTINLREN